VVNVVHAQSNSDGCKVLAYILGEKSGRPASFDCKKIGAGQIARFMCDKSTFKVCTGSDCNAESTEARVKLVKIETLIFKCFETRPDKDVEPSLLCSITKPNQSGQCKYDFKPCPKGTKCAATGGAEIIPSIEVTDHPRIIAKKGYENFCKGAAGRALNTPNKIAKFYGTDSKKTISVETEPSDSPEETVSAQYVGTEAETNTVARYIAESLELTASNSTESPRITETELIPLDLQKEQKCQPLKSVESDY